MREQQRKEQDAKIKRAQSTKFLDPEEFEALKFEKKAESIMENKKISYEEMEEVRRKLKEEQDAQKAQDQEEGEEAKRDDVI